MPGEGEAPDQPGTVRVFIGTEPKTAVPCEILKFSIRANTRHAVEFVELDGRFPMPEKRHGTGFSLRRWMIPEFCGFKGRAIYLDADMLVLADIWDLWIQPEQIGGGPLWLCYKPERTLDKEGATPKETSVMVIDCAGVGPGNPRKLRPWIPADLWKLMDGTQTNYRWFMTCGWLDFEPTAIAARWNDLNSFESGKTRLVHYTKESTQPWFKPDHPHRDLWQDYFDRAVKERAVTLDQLRAALNFPEPRWRLHPFYDYALKEAAS